MCGARPRSDNALPSFKRREVRRRVASDAPVIALDDTLDHFGPGIDQVGRDHEVVVIDDPVYPSWRVARGCARSRAAHCRCPAANEWRAVRNWREVARTPDTFRVIPCRLADPARACGMGAK